MIYYVSYYYPLMKGSSHRGQLINDLPVLAKKYEYYSLYLIGIFNI